LNRQRELDAEASVARPGCAKGLCRAVQLAKPRLDVRQPYTNRRTPIGGVPRVSRRVRGAIVADAEHKRLIAVRRVNPDRSAARVRLDPMADRVLDERL